MIWRDGKNDEKLDYLFQLSEKLERQLQNIYETNSTEEWKLLKHTYEEKPVGCDYKNCPRANPKNGIKEIFHVQNKNTGELLRLGSDCYLKLIYDKEELTKKEKKESERLLKKTKKMEEEFLESIQEIKQYMSEKYYSFKIKLEKLEIPFLLSETLVVAEAQFKQANSIEELKRLAKLLENYYYKYLLELENLKNVWEKYYNNNILKYHIQETDEENVEYELYDIVKMKKAHVCKSNCWEIIRMGAHIKIKCRNCERIIMMTRREFNKNLVRIIARFLIAVKKNGHIVMMTHREYDEKLAKNISECLITLKNYKV